VVESRIGVAGKRAAGPRMRPHLFDGAYSDVNDELERAWKGSETAHTPAHIEAQNGAAAFHLVASAADETPAKMAD
jgi:hypothetical protein